jgi:hypothetical protein
MNATRGIDTSLSFICSQFSGGALPNPEQSAVPRCAITISRQSGCGAHAVADRVAAFLQAGLRDGEPWVVYDRNLVERVLADHKLPERLARFMPEDRHRSIDEFVHDLFGVRPPVETLVLQTAETIRQLAEKGNAIILGRGGNLLTARLPNVVHVRMIAPLETRISNQQKYEGLTRREATERIRQEDLGRARYIRTHFERDIDDPFLYHLVLNTGMLSIDDAARIIADLVLQRVGIVGNR